MRSSLSNTSPQAADTRDRRSAVGATAHELRLLRYVGALRARAVEEACWLHGLPSQVTIAAHKQPNESVNSASPSRQARPAAAVPRRHTIVVRSSVEACCDESRHEERRRSSRRRDPPRSASASRSPPGRSCRRSPVKLDHPRREVRQTSGGTPSHHRATRRNEGRRSCQGCRDRRLCRTASTGSPIRLSRDTDPAGRSRHTLSGLRARASRPAPLPQLPASALGYFKSHR